MSVSTPTGGYADLEIRILEKTGKGYPVEITFSGERQFPRGYLDPGVLPWKRRVSTAAEGEELFERLFGDPELGEAWAEARGHNRLRRVRLRVDEGAPELHSLPWELLRDAGAATPRDLAADVETPFSRYLADDRPPGQPLLDRPIKALVAIANPDGLDDYGLAPFDPELEKSALGEAVAAAGAGQLEVAFLAPPVTLAALDAEIRKGFHVLHLVAHGACPKDGPAVLFLAGDDGRVAVIEGRRLAEMIERQGASLRLVYLSSCQSATRDPKDAWRGIAPALVKAGVPAVLAMQDLVAIDTARAFAGTFYRRLVRHGLVDLAANEARSVVQSADLPGAAIPVLFLRLRSGRLFERRGKIVGGRGESFWKVLLENLADGECTPFLGPRVTAGLLPDAGEIARALAREHAYPFADAGHLPRVAQFIATIDNMHLRKAVVGRLRDGFRRRFRPPPDAGECRGDLSAAIAASGWPDLPELAEHRIHQQLADLGLPLYLTTNFDNFLTLALAARGRRPRREILPWHRRPVAASGGPFHDFQPPASAAEPVVLHLFGNDREPLSMVLTEDDHLDYLGRISRDHEHLLATSVGEAVARNTLLFLGYRLQDLDFKILLRGFLAHLDLARWGRYHVTVQIDETERDPARQEEVLRYFEKYFGNSRIDVYWGSSRQFVADLHARWLERRDG